MNPLDTLVWLANFPVSNGFAVALIAGFALPGALMMTRRVKREDDHLQALRAQQGLPGIGPGSPGTTAMQRLQRAAFAALSAVLTLSLALGVLGMLEVPLTRSYIHSHGVPTVGTITENGVTFTSAVGVEYSLLNNFFAPSVYPDQRAYLRTGEPVVVRYLPSHPQAYVIDSTQLP